MRQEGVLNSPSPQHSDEPSSSLLTTISSSHAVRRCTPESGACNHPKNWWFQFLTICPRFHVMSQVSWLQMKHLLFLWLCGQKNQNCSGFFSTRHTKKCSCSKVPEVSIHKTQALVLAVSLFNQSFTYSPCESWDPWCQLSWECRWSWQLHDDNFPYHQDCKLWWELSQAPSIISSSIKTSFCWRCWRFFLTTSPHPPPSSWFCSLQAFFSIYTSSNTFLADPVSASCALPPWYLLLCFLSPPVSFSQFSLSSSLLSHAKLIFLANLFSTSF